MKALVVSYCVMKGFGGGVFAARATVNAVAAVCDDVTLLFPADRAGDRDPEVDPAVRQVGVTDPVSKPRKLLRTLRRGTLHRFEQAFHRLMEEARYDLVVFHNSKATRRLLPLAKARGAKVVTVHDNYEYEYTRDNFPWYHLWYLLPLTVKGEREAVLGSDLNLVLSAQDRELLQKAYDPSHRSRIEVLGVFEYQDRPLPVLPERVREDVFAITGNLGVSQTLDSLFPWLDTCWPMVQEVLPGSRLILAGKNPVPALKQRAESLGAELVDTPRDMGSVLQRAKYYVCPVCKGGGVKLRVMDGLRYGLPVLVHQVSARGYDPFIGRSLFVYDAPASFRAALAQMLETDVDRPSVQELYRASFSFPSGVARMEKFLSSL